MSDAVERSTFFVYLAFYNKATPSVTSEQGKLRQPLLRRGRALMPAPPFPTNLLLRKIFAGALLLPPS